MIGQAFGVESMSRTRVFGWHARVRADRKRRDRWRAKSRACSTFPLTSRGLSIKDSSWQAKEYIPHTTATFYGDCVKVCKDFAPNFGDKRTGCCITTTHRLTLAFSPPALLFSLSMIEDKTERQSFWKNLGDRGRIAGAAVHPHRTRLPGCI
jgi:hypothetical protein